MKDKRDECGCHKECTTLEHECEKKCIWPKCLTSTENRALVLEIQLNLFDEILEGPCLECKFCGYEFFHAQNFECHEIGPGFWIWVCLPCVEVTGLREGK